MKRFKNTGFLVITLLCTSFVYNLQGQKNNVPVKGAQKALLNVKDIEGTTPLHRAVKNNQLESAKTLLENGARPNIKNKNGQTPLHLAVELENAAEFIELLIKHGARPNARDLQDRRAIDLTTDDTIKDLLIAQGTRVRKNKPAPEEPQAQEIKIASTASEYAASAQDTDSKEEQPTLADEKDTTENVILENVYQENTAE